MKHAYLILAHNEVVVLELLLSLLDDERNDIFIHWDAKNRRLPELTLIKSRIYFVENRIDVRWGDASVVQAELELFKAALDTDTYAYLHLLSGVDLPLKSQNEIHAFFEQHQGKEFIGFFQGDNRAEVIRKVQRWHLFPHSFRNRQIGIRMLRALFLKVQEWAGWKRNRDVTFKKGTQWVSITAQFARYVLEHERDIRRIYSHTFCADEIVLQTLCWNSDFRKRIYDDKDEGRGCLRAIKWKNNRIEDWTLDEVKSLQDTEALFARKFSERQLDVLKYLSSTME